MRVSDYTEADFPSISVSAYYGSGEGEHTFIACDFCDNVWGFQGPEVDCVIGLHSDGWVTMGEMDFCPDCCGGEVV